MLTIKIHNGTIMTTNLVGIGGVFARQSGNSRDYFLKNAHGDVTAVTNGSTITKTYEYDAYGVEKNPDANDTNPFRYCGEYYDAESGLIYLRARYYDPPVGRFITEDTHWDVGNMIFGDNNSSNVDMNSVIQSSNLYLYCSGNPVMFFDPNGNVAGELFTSTVELAKDWAWNYYGFTDYIMYEKASLIYSITYDNGEIFYGYTEAVVGGPHSVRPLDAIEMVPQGANVIAAIHSHPNSDLFSDADKNFAVYNQMQIYVVVPSTEVAGKVDIKSYAVEDGIYQEQSSLFIGHEFLPETSERKKELVERFKSLWYLHLRKNDGCVNKVWPRERRNF